MQEDEPEERLEIWGIPVSKQANGRRNWPDKVRAMAVERIAAGTKIKEIAIEIGAHKSLIARWVREAQSTQSTDISSNTMPAFVEVLPPAQREAPPAVAARADASQPPEAAICRIRIGGADVDIPAGYPTAHLVEVLRAVRASQ